MAWSLIDQTWIIFTKECVLSLAENDPAVLDKINIKFCHSIFVILLLTPLGEGPGDRFTNES